jgi:ubiquinol-cytochrome c reductase iron-sulfur subunit
MSEDGIDYNRRRFLTTTASVVGGVGAAATAVPFISTMTPSAKARAIGAPVEVDISELAPGDRMIVKWQGKPVWILRRNEKMLNDLNEMVDLVDDPDSEVEQQPAYAQNEYRAINSEYLIVIGLCTHLGCSPTLYREDDEHDLGADWNGGFFCPCHGSRFDLAGRVYKSVPAPTNLIVPPHQYLSETRLIIGDDSGVT